MQGWAASSQTLHRELVTTSEGIKASWRDSPGLSSDRCHQCPLPRHTGLSVSKGHGEGCQGHHGVGSQVPRDKHPQADFFPTRAGVAGNAAPVTHLWLGENKSLAGKGELWGQEVPGVQRGHPILAPVRHQPCQGQDILPKAPSTLAASACLQQCGRNSKTFVPSIKPCA